MKTKKELNRGSMMLGLCLAAVTLAAGPVLAADGGTFSSIRNTFEWDDGQYARANVNKYGSTATNCANNNHSESIWWARKSSFGNNISGNYDGQCNPSVFGTEYIHGHGQLNSAVVEGPSSTLWTIGDDNAFVWGHSVLNLAARQDSAAGSVGDNYWVGKSEAHINEYVYRNVLGVPMRNPYDIKSYVDGSTTSCGGAPAGSFDNHSASGTYFYPRLGHKYNTNIGERNFCNPKWHFQSKDADIVWDDASGTFWITWVERYFDNPTRSDLNNGTNLPTGANTFANYGEWKVYVAQYNPSSDTLTHRAGPGDVGSLNYRNDYISSRQPVYHAFSPRITLVNGVPWVAWSEQGSSIHNYTYGAYWNGSSWVRAGYTVGGLSGACRTVQHPGNSTSGKEWNPAFSYANNFGYNNTYSRTANEGYQVDIASALISGTQRPIIAVASAATVSGSTKCHIMTHYWNGSGWYDLGSSGNATNNISGIYGSNSQFYNPRLATVGDDVYVAFIDFSTTESPWTGNAMDLGNGGYGRVRRLKTSNLASNWSTINAKSSSAGSSYSYWGSGSSSIAIAAQADYNFYGMCAFPYTCDYHRVSVLTNGSYVERRDIYIESSSVTPSRGEFLTASQFADSSGTDANAGNSYEGPVDLIITSNDSTSAWTYSWETAATFVQQRAGHRRYDGLIYMKYDGDADPQ